jgi:hypothetical protein
MKQRLDLCCGRYQWVTNEASEAVDSAALPEAVVIQVEGPNSRHLWKSFAAERRVSSRMTGCEADWEKSYLSAAARSLERPEGNKSNARLGCWFALYPCLPCREKPKRLSRSMRTYLKLLLGGCKRLARQESFREK